jgi:membrane protease subunit (stomatin/prohibitin family)
VLFFFVLQSYCDEVQAGINQATTDANTLLPITLKLTGGKVSDCLPSAAEMQLPSATANAAAAVGNGQGLPLQQVQQLQQLQQVQQAQQLVQAAAANGGSHRHSTQLHQ